MDCKVAQKALDLFGYGVYIVSSVNEGRLNGQVSNAVIQVCAAPARVAVAINKNELTHDFIMKSDLFSVSVLEETTPMTLIGLFGFKSGRDINKFDNVAYEKGSSGVPLVIQNAIAVIECRVTQTCDTGTHTLFIGEVIDARVLSEGAPMTYAYYHVIKKGKTPKNAPTYRDVCDVKRGEAPGTQNTAGAGLVSGKILESKAESSQVNFSTTNNRSSAMKKYVCDVCGYIYDPAVGDPDSGIQPGTAFEAIPDNWVCPLCGAGKSDFSPVE